MTNNESPTGVTPEPENAGADAVRLAAIKSQLDQLFRQAGNGHETRALYHAVLDYRMENGK